MGPVPWKGSIESVGWTGMAAILQKEKVRISVIHCSEKKKIDLLKPMLPCAQGLQFMIFIHSLSVKNALQET